MNITLETIDAIQPSTYNPRSAVPERLDLIELSLRKLGFIAPIFADADGEILSGHQRHLVASRMGATHVPVFRTKALDLDQRQFLLRLLHVRLGLDVAAERARERRAAGEHRLAGPVEALVADIGLKEILLVQRHRRGLTNLFLVERRLQHFE